jgi:hypothetical protein
MLDFFMSDPSGIRVSPEHVPIVSGKPLFRSEQLPQDVWMTPVAPRHLPSPLRMRAGLRSHSES